MEWTTVTVIAALVGLGATVIRPIVTLTRSITRLTVVVEGLREDMDRQQEHSRVSHQKIWEHCARQDDRLEDHDRRICRLEQG